MNSTASNARQAVGPAPRRLQPERRYVYVIGPREGLQKIGLATDPQTRLAALQTASPLPLMLHVTVAVPFGAAHAVERQAHAALAQRRAAGEWFDVAPQQAVAVVRAAAGALGMVAAPETPHGPLFAYARASAAERTVRPPVRLLGLRRACRELIGRWFLEAHNIYPPPSSRTDG